MVHRTAIQHAKLFHDTYLDGRPDLTVIEIGSLDVNGSIRCGFVPSLTYVGLDFAPGPGVDVVIEDPYALPLADEFADAVVSSSCFEHSEFFWLAFLEAVRITKSGGLLYINAPSNGPVHAYPVDCWRFYPDAPQALARWAQRNGQDVVLLESYIGPQEGGLWNDMVAVFLKGSSHYDAHPRRMLHSLAIYENARLHPQAEMLRQETFPEDQRVQLQAAQAFGRRLQAL